MSKKFLGFLLENTLYLSSRVSFRSLLFPGLLLTFLGVLTSPYNPSLFALSQLKKVKVASAARYGNVRSPQSLIAIGILQNVYSVIYIIINQSSKSREVISKDERLRAACVSVVCSGRHSVSHQYSVDIHIYSTKILHRYWWIISSKLFRWPSEIARGVTTGFRGVLTTDTIGFNVGVSKDRILINSAHSPI